MAYPNPSEYNEKLLFQIPTWCGTSQQRRSNEIPGVVTSFDNTPRRNFAEAHVWAHTPEENLWRFRKNLYTAIYYETCCFPRQPAGEDSFVLINAMNEWAEGMSMEPSDVYRMGFLEAVLDVKERVRVDGCALRNNTQNAVR